MTLQLSPHPSLPRRRPVVVVIADGVGEATAGPSNAVTQAHTPNLDRLRAAPLTTQLAAHGPAVGLPSSDDMGNSEVGHNALGAGRVFAQGAKLVNQAIADGTLWDGKVWLQAIATATEPGATLHLIGLHSDGNVHSHNDHLYAMLAQAARQGVRRARVHILLDGRDVPPRSALGYIARTEEVLAELNTAHGVDFAIASGGGRMAITMDRYDADWPMVKRGYDCHVHGQGRPFANATEAVETLYGESDLGDQYLEAFAIVDNDGEPVGRIASGDAVILYNFRGDRAIEISRAFEDPRLAAFERDNPPEVFFAGMLQYDGDALIPENYLVDPPEIDRTMGEYLVSAGCRSFAVSETQKYGHVTYFWNGNRSGYLDADLETYIEVPSDNVPFDQAPAMKAEAITTEVIALLDSGDYDWGRLNYANGDMVGHTGDLDATVESMEVLDRELGRLMDAVERLGGVLVFTADHGNADIMYTETNGERVPKTSHTLSPVICVVWDPTGQHNYQITPLGNPGLANVAATVMNLLGFEAPPDYEPSLIS